MTKARTNASVAPAVGRNMIINGAMNVAQRSASVTGLGAAAGYFTLDRFQMSTDTGGNATAGRYTMTQTADGPNGISANCLKLDCTTIDTSIAAGELLAIVQKFEGQNVQRIGKGIAGAKQITASFYVKGNAAANYMLEIKDTDNGRINSKLFAVTTDWNRIEVTIPADVDDGSSALNDDNATSLEFRIWLHAGSNYTSGTASNVWANQTQANRAAGISSFFDATTRTFFLTGVQMEVGPVATEFEQEDIGTTLAKCQRYYQKWLADTAADSVATGLQVADTVNASHYSLRQTMRAVPTLATDGDFAILIDATERPASSIAINRATKDTVGIRSNIADNNENGKAGLLRTASDNDAFIEFIAEL